jgi:hypothetical protein
MLRALITVALVLGSSATPEQAKIKPAASKSPDRVSASDYQPSPDFDEQAEQQLLEMANQARAKAGAPPLQFDDGLTQAARSHAAAMARDRQLAPTEWRALAATPVVGSQCAQLDRSGENVVELYCRRGSPEPDALSAASRKSIGRKLQRSGLAVIRSESTFTWCRISAQLVGLHAKTKRKLRSRMPLVARGGRRICRP